MKRTGPILILLALALAFTTVASATSEASPSYSHDPGDLEFGDDYGSGDYGRVRYVENGVTIERNAADPEGEATTDGTINAPVRPGDSLRTAPNQRVEVELAGGSLVRIDRGSELVFQSLPDPYLEVRDNTILAMRDGTIRVAAYVGEDDTFRVDTPAASVYLIGDADIRIEVGNHGRTVVSSWRGVAEIAGDGGSILVRAGMRAEAFPGSYPQDPRPFNTLASDPFDRWVAERDRAYRVNDRYHGDDNTEVYGAIPTEVRPYYRELSVHGRWVYTGDYGWCWYPFDVATGWRPYQDGYWDYGPSGYFWVSHEPWGWAPYHYGRWDWLTGYGWCWIPGRVFGGAWVSWSWGSVYVGWSPLNYWNRPVLIGDPWYDYYCPHSWTFIRYGHFHHRHYRRYAVHVRHVGHGIRGGAIVTRPPRVRPRDLARDPSARDRAYDDARRRIARRDPDGPGNRRDDGGRRITKRRFLDREEQLIRKGERGRRADRIGRRTGNGIGAEDTPVGTADVRRRGPAGRGETPGTARRTAPGDRPGRTVARPTAPAGKDLRKTARSPRSDSPPEPRQRTRVLTGRGRTPDREGRDGRTPSGATRRGTAREKEDTGERVRDMYRRYSQPRTTRKSADSAPPSRSDRPQRSGAQGRSGQRREPARPQDRTRSGEKRNESRRQGPVTNRRQSNPRASTPGTSSRRPSSRVSTPRSAPRPSAPRAGSPRTAPRRQTTPRVSTPRSSSSRSSSPRASTPRSAPRPRSSAGRGSSSGPRSAPSRPQKSSGGGSGKSERGSGRSGKKR